MSEHILIVREDESWTLECPEGNGCEGWMGCMMPHEVDGVSADAGPDECPHSDCELDAGAACSFPWADQEEFEFHSELHTWRSGYGWVTPYRGCIVDACNVDPPDGLWDREAGCYKQGRWIVESDWYDYDECVLLLVGPEAVSDE